ncbi:MAG: DUF3883 domain-containing protein [Burkholderiaceae bacterium]
MSVEKIAIAAAFEFFRNRGYEVTVVSASRQPEHSGCDLVIKRSGATETVEVKGTSNEWKIPDLYDTEVRNGQLTADKLLLVYIVDGEPRTFCEIPKDEIKPEEFRERRGFRIVEGVKNANRLSRHLKPLNPPPAECDA